MEVSFTIQNTGPRARADVAQVYEVGFGDETMLKSGNMTASPAPPESTIGLLLKRALRFAASSIATIMAAGLGLSAVIRN